jgi:hypothetical protein
MPDPTAPNKSRGEDATRGCITASSEEQDVILGMLR